MKNILFLVHLYSVNLCTGYNYYGQLGYNDNDTRGDGADEMGDNLAVVPIWFPGDPIKAPTASPTTSAPTNHPTTEPTTEPTIDPTTEPTLIPTALCDPLRNCTECLHMNPDNRTWCLWHSTHNRCDFVSDLVHIDQNVIIDESSCITIEFSDSIELSFKECTVYA